MTTTTTFTDTVYKYLSPSRSSFFEDFLLRFTQPSALNDPFECVPVLTMTAMMEGLEKGIKEAKALYAKTRRSNTSTRKEAKLKLEQVRRIRDFVKENPQKVRYDFLSGGMKNLNLKLGILSLSRRWDSALMWAHYSASHQGVCVGFDREHPFFKESKGSPDGFGYLKPVVYSENRVQIPMEVGKSIDIDIIYTKSLDWSYEQEERMIWLLQFADQIINSESFPSHLFKIPNSAMTEITLGAKAPNDIKDAAADCAQKLGIPIYQARVSDHKFDMIREHLK